MCVLKTGSLGDKIKLFLPGVRRMAGELAFTDDTDVRRGLCAFMAGMEVFGGGERFSDSSGL